MSVLTRKSWNDIRRRPARSLFTVATIAAAVASISLFAVAPLMDRAMEDRVAAHRLHDIRFFVEDTALSEPEIDELRAIPGVTALETRTTHPTRMRIGDRREDVLLVGVADFGAQSVNAIGLDSGTAPVAGEALSDGQNARTGRFDGSVGATVDIEAADGTLRRLTISGRGGTMEFTLIATEEQAVLYLPQEAVNQIAGGSGVSSIELRVADPEDAQAVADAVTAWFAANRPETVFSDLADVREAGTWPGQDIFENFTTLFYVGAVLALISGVALISNTMTTMVAEQRREIAIMRAIGGGRWPVTSSVLRTVLILATAGIVVGIGLGFLLSNLVTRFVAAEFEGMDPGWGIVVPVIVASVLIGFAVTSLAAVPALLRAGSTTVREGLAAGVSATSGSPLDRALRALPLPRMAQIGVRNITRRRARTLGTVLQVGLAIGVALGFLSLGVTISTVTADTWDTLRWDFIAAQRSNTALDEGAGDILRALEGVETVHPLLYNTLEVDGNQLETWGYPASSDLYDHDVVEGRWFDEADEAAAARVAVIGRALSNTQGLGVGDTLVARSATGLVEFEVIGIDSRLANNAMSIFIPFGTFQDILGRSDTNAYWVRATSQDEPFIDALAADAEDALEAAGYPVSTEIRYVERAANVSSNQVITAVLAIMGVPIVAIGLIGLVNMMTMNVIERTREIGILRCIGASARSVSSIFRYEALATALAGWILAVPLGWLIGWVLVRFITELFHFGSVPYTYPGWYPPLALVLTIVLVAMLVIPPLRRASHLKPGDALRYE